MTTQHVSLRLPSEMIQRLDEESRRTGQTRSETVKIILDEGLRMQAHPGIVFRPGPVGRRPGIVNGPDVWEIIRVFRDLDSSGDDRIEETGKLTGLSARQVWIAARYYAEFREEIDSWIDRVQEEAERAEAAWRRQQALLHG